MKLILLCGPSGAGKTHARTTEADLAKLPYVDMGELRGDFYDWRRDIAAAMDRLVALSTSEPVAALEGYFLPGSASRSCIERLCAERGWELEVRWFDAPLQLRRERVLARQSRLLEEAKTEEEARRIRRATESMLRLLEYGADRA
jgi:hypothetical protein